MKWVVEFGNSEEKTKERQVNLLKAHINMWNQYLAAAKSNEVTATGKSVQQLQKLLAKVICSHAPEKKVLLQALQDVRSLIRENISQKWKDNNITKCWNGNITDKGEGIWSCVWEWNWKYVPNSFRRSSRFDLRWIVYSVDDINSDH